jgi:hypothetical protein
MLRRAIVHAGGGETEGRRSGKDPHPKAELLGQLAVAAGWRGDGCSGDQEAAAIRRLGLQEREAVDAGLTSSRARGRHFIGRPQAPWRAGPDDVQRGAVPCHGRTQARARVWLKVGDGPDRRVPPINVRGRGEEESW